MLSDNNAPFYIALCGRPKSGKSEVQRMLDQRYHVQPVDDGLPLRDFAIRHLGATFEDVNTQEGKSRTVHLHGGKTMTWRQFLGEFGNLIEAFLGPDSIPEMAIAKSQEAGKMYSFGSVRREQGFVYRRHGGIVVEVVNKFIPPSEYEFDNYNPAPVQYVIENHVHPDERSADTLHELQGKIITLFDGLIGAPVAGSVKQVA